MKPRLIRSQRRPPWSTRNTVSKRQPPPPGVFRWNPQLPSDGNTIDTPTGPVDLAVVQRIIRGEPTDYTSADREYVYSLIGTWRAPYTMGVMEDIAHGLGVTPKAVDRGYNRARNRRQQEGGDASCEP